VRVGIKTNARVEPRDLVTLLGEKSGLVEQNTSTSLTHCPGPQNSTAAVSEAVPLEIEGETAGGSQETETDPEKRPIDVMKSSTH